MVQTRLQETLNELHAQLAEHQDLTDEQRAQLESISEEIQAVLASDAPSGSSGLMEQVDEARQHFAASHPVLTNTVGRIADLLSQLGI